MPLVNKGPYDIQEVYQRKLGNNWPIVDPRLTASADFANIALTLDNFTTANLAESASKQYFTIPKVRESYTAGAGINITSNGIISIKATETGTGIFSAGINQTTIKSINAENTDIISMNDSNSYIIYSVTLTNSSNDLIYVDGTLNLDYIFESNIDVTFVKNLEVPEFATIELFAKPKVFRRGGLLQLRSYDSSMNPAGNAITAITSFQLNDEATYFAAAREILDGNVTEVFNSIGMITVVESIEVTNLSDEIVPFTLDVRDDGGNVLSYLTSNLGLPPYSSIEIAEKPKVVGENENLSITKFNDSGNISVLVAAKETITYAIEESEITIYEGSSGTLHIETTNLPDGAILNYDIVAINANLTEIDFVGPLEGTLLIRNNSNIITLYANADNNTDIEGLETVRFRLKTYEKGSVVAECLVNIIDSSNVPNYDSIIVEQGDFIVAGEYVTFNVIHPNIGEGSTLYYRTSGNVTADGFVGNVANTGSFFTGQNSTKITLQSNVDYIPLNETRYFNLEIMELESGEPVLASSNVTVYDSSYYQLQALGGTITTEGGFRTHVFTESGNFELFKRAQNPVTVSYMVQAGGGGGGGSYTAAADGGAGGGGGGHRTGTLEISNTGPSYELYPIVIGGGGAGGTVTNNSTGPFYVAANNRGSPGGVSSAFGTSSAGGGGGGAFSLPPSFIREYNGLPGGSGGGQSRGSPPSEDASGAGNSPPVSPVQGYRGGKNINSLTPGYDTLWSGAGGGGAGANAPDTTYTNTFAYWPGGYGGIGRVSPISPSSYGTTGPAPGSRYFGGGGGGGGGGHPQVSFGLGGSGGGGPGAGPTNGLDAPSGITNTGGGGGGFNGYGVSGKRGGNGGKGIVIIRYPYSV